MTSDKKILIFNSKEDVKLDELDDIERMIKLGVDAIITDYPERINK